jgi:hypothetical protein
MRLAASSWHASEKCSVSDSHFRVFYEKQAILRNIDFVSGRIADIKWGDWVGCVDWGDLLGCFEWVIQGVLLVHVSHAPSPHCSERDELPRYICPGTPGHVANKGLCRQPLDDV